MYTLSKSIGSFASDFTSTFLFVGSRVSSLFRHCYTLILNCIFHIFLLSKHSDDGLRFDSLFGRLNSRGARNADVRFLHIFNFPYASGE